MIPDRTRHAAHLSLQALRVSVGRLGIIGRVKFHIVLEVPVRR